MPKVKKVEKKYSLVDCSKENLGRLATKIAYHLQGKHYPTYLPNTDCGDFIVAVNCSKLKFSGNKNEKKLYHHYSGYPGGITTRTLSKQLELDPVKVVRDAVYGMLPKNNLRPRMMKRLIIFENAHDLSNNIEEII